MRRVSILVCIFLLIPFFSLQARDNIVFYQMGDRNPALWSGLKKYFTGKGYGVSIYESADSIETTDTEREQDRQGKGSHIFGC